MKRTLFSGAGRALRHRRAQRYRLFCHRAGQSGTHVHSGRLGPLFSDEGSGYHIGVLCLSRLALLHDTHVTGTLLEKNVLEMLGLPDVLSIRDAAYGPILRAGMWRG